MRNYMVDTNIFNRILDSEERELDFKHFQTSDSQFYVTHVQRDEINKTPDESRRQELLKIFLEISINIPTKSALWGVSKWGVSNWPKDNLVSEILTELDRLKKKKNNNKDALIADTAIKNDMTLLTEDRDLFDTTKKLGGSVERLQDFLKV